MPSTRKKSVPQATEASPASTIAALSANADEHPPGTPPRARSALSSTSAAASTIPDYLFDMSTSEPVKFEMKPGIPVEQRDTLLPPALLKGKQPAMSLTQKFTLSKSAGKCVRCFTNVATHTMPCCQCGECPMRLCEADYKVEAKMSIPAQEDLARVADTMCPRAPTGGDTIRPSAPTGGDVIRPHAPPTDGTIRPRAPARGDTK